MKLQNKVQNDSINFSSIYDCVQVKFFLILAIDCYQTYSFLVWTLSLQGTAITEFADKYTNVKFIKIDVDELHVRPLAFSRSSISSFPYLFYKSILTSNELPEQEVAQ